MAIRVTAFSPDFFVSDVRRTHLLPQNTFLQNRFLDVPADEKSHRSSMVKDAHPPAVFKGWKQIADFLGEPTSVVQRWASEGMPVVKQGRFVSSSPAELNAWLGREAGKPIHVVTPQSDLSAELKRGLAFVRHHKPRKQPASATSKHAKRKAS